MHQAAIAQAVERHIGNVEVTGPTPVSSFFKKFGTGWFQTFFVYTQIF